MQNEIEYLMRVIRPQLIKDCKNMFNVEFQVSILLSDV